MDFNRLWNLVRDQGVGGSNPLSPTNFFKHLQRCGQPSGIGPGTLALFTALAIGRRYEVVGTSIYKTTSTLAQTRRLSFQLAAIAASDRLPPPSASLWQGA